MVLAAYRGTPHESTGLSPNKLFLGREVRTPIDLVMVLPPDAAKENMDNHEYLNKLQCDASKSYQLARKHLRASAERPKKEYDVRADQNSSRWGTGYTITTRGANSQGQLSGRNRISNDRTCELCFAEVSKVETVCRPCRQTEGMSRRVTCVVDH